MNLSSEEALQRSEDPQAKKKGGQIYHDIGKVACSAERISVELKGKEQIVSVEAYDTETGWIERDSSSLEGVCVCV